MTFESRILALIEEGNPLPNPESIETMPREAADYLDAITRRSDQMTQLDDRKQEKRGQRRPLVPILAALAALAALIVGVVVVLANQSPDVPPVITEPPPVTTIPEPTITTSPDVDADWNATKTLAGLSPLPGEYRTDKFVPAFRYEITPGWKQAEIERSFTLGLTPASEWDDATDAGPDLAIYFVKPEADSIEAATQIFRDAGVIHLGPPTPTQIGGAEGIVFTADSDAYRFSLMARDMIDGYAIFIDEDKAYEVNIVSVADEIVTVIVQAPPETFEDFKVRARTLLDTVVWKDLG